MKTCLYRASNLKSTITFLASVAEVNFWRPLKTVLYCDLFIIIIKECSSTLYVGLQHAVVMAHPAPPTNTNFQITLLLTRLPKALYDCLRGGSRNFGGGSQLKSRLFKKDAVTAERIEFRIIQPINCYCT